ncbi:hypothetical protein [Bradyrhizobium sp. 2TAF24]|uniref:hypothetical protein n=1 Tax=Bradyrhizobium sp. 2TAF24 TaxID=3233011 RepID=UPI003F8F309A
MRVRRWLRFLLAALVTAGLTIAPLALPAVAKSLSPAGGSPAVMAPMTDMSDMDMADMPCCPDKQKSDDCRDCPLMAMCMLKVLQTGPIVTAGQHEPNVREQLHPRDDLMAEGLTRPPPDQPPRFLS